MHTAPDAAGAAPDLPFPHPEGPRAERNVMTTATATTPLTIPAGRYQLDPVHSRLGFAIRHMVTHVHGHFATFTGHIEVPDGAPEQVVAELDIDPASIDTGNPDRDAHLRSPDFLDVDRYPTMTFRSRSACRTEGGQYVATGELTIRGITRRVELTMTVTGVAVDPYRQLRLGLTGTGVLRRRDFGLTWNVALEGGGFVLGDRVTLELDASAVADTAPA
jgi:polyisoprenoid-binding protein YceI